MTIDERVEALTLNLEIMSGMIKDMLARTEERDKKAEERDKKAQERDKKIDERFDKILTILEAHQDRLDRIEGKETP